MTIKTSEFARNGEAWAGTESQSNPKKTRCPHPSGSQRQMKSFSFAPHRKRAFGFVGMILIIILLYPCSSVYADFRDFLSKFHPYISLQEDYTDNLFLTHTNTQDDWITTVSPGLRFSTTTANSGIDLNYLLGLVFYAKHSEDNYVSHSGALNTWYDFAPRLTFRLRDVLVRSEEPREVDYALGAPSNQLLLGTARTRSVYTRNVLEPSLLYQFGREDRFELSYRNNIYRNENPLFENSEENFINPRLTYWFNIQNGIILEYAFTLADFERSADFQGHMARARYNYRFNPHTTIFGEFTFRRYDFDSPGIDYNVYNPSIGMDHAFSPTVSGTVQIGYFWLDREQGGAGSGLSCDVRLTKLADRTTYSIALQGGYGEDYFTAENLGGTQYYRAIGSISHRLRERITLGMDGTVQRSEFLGSNRDDWFWRVGGRVFYQLFQWLTLSVEAYHMEGNSNINDLSYTENRGILRIRAAL
jgi:hypothetical protein